MPERQRAAVVLHPDFRVGTVDRRMFGSFVEHIGRAVYTGLYEPGHATADAHGFRRDVADLTRELGVTTVRYPGGNFVSNYVWEDGVGPREGRVPFIDLAWRTIEPNEIGTDEFLQWAEREGIEPMMAVNLGTRGVAAAAALVEYCNGEAGSRWADLRIANGREKPYGVRLWCLGNEMDGPWQIGHKDAHEYGRLAAEAGKAMKLVDPTIELVACGSSSMQMSTFGSWERTVLSYTYDVVDHLSMHAYYEDRDGDRASFLGSGTAMDRFIQRVVATADAVGAERRSDKQITVSFDEWNVWYLESRFAGGENLPLQRDAPRVIEDVYSALDGVVVGDLLVTLVNHADRIPVACLAQMVNAIAPIMTEPDGPAWRQPTFHPFAITSRLASGQVLRVQTTSPTISTEKFGEVEAVDAVATYDDGKLAVFLVNRSLDQTIEVSVDVSRTGVTTVEEALTLADDDRQAVNSATQPDRVAPHAAEGVRLEDGKLTISLPPISWTALSLA